jgi:molecular chaperone HscB
MADNYFAYYGFEPSLSLDETELRRRYLEKSRLFHPDYYAQAHPDEQTKALTETAFNNVAFNVLKDPEKRTAHFLQIYGILDETGSPVEPIDLGKDFLAAVMEAGEELETGADAEQLRRRLEAEWLNGETQIRDHAPNPDTLRTMAMYYLRRKYLQRLGA